MTRRIIVGMIRRFGIYFRSLPHEWDRKDIPKRRIIPTILRSVITQKSYNVSFVVAEALDHKFLLLLLLLLLLTNVRSGLS